MQINDTPYSAMPVPHGMGPASRVFLVRVFFGKKAQHTFIVMANNSRDARARLKKNALATIKLLEETHWHRCYRTLEERTFVLRGTLAAIKNNKIKITELGSDRVYPVAKFDEVVS
jgi:hypothetical protein